ncbi:MAG: DUF2934 domain-containing protein [Dehalococcoides mccartyi]|uniref:DUF2934 domain-containing protein n=1 Tax=Dehalococcoides mccartyi TaxID=61435 RepID=UPI0030F52447
MGREEEIRLIAYSIWEQEGCCNGHDMEHWLRAEAIWEEKQEQRKDISPKAGKKNEELTQAKKSRSMRKKS